MAGKCTGAAAGCSKMAAAPGSRSASDPPASPYRAQVVVVVSIGGLVARAANQGSLGSRMWPEIVLEPPLGAARWPPLHRLGRSRGLSYRPSPGGEIRRSRPRMTLQTAGWSDGQVGNQAGLLLTADGFGSPGLQQD